MNKIKITRIILLILIIAWAIMVFNFSNQNADDSSGVSRKVVEFFIKDNEDLVDKIEPYIRKLAHFTEYGLGGILITSLLVTYKWSDNRTIIISGLIGIWYAALDEIHQSMVPGRHAGIEDVFIDSLGFLTGVIFLYIIIKIIELIKNKRKIENAKTN